MSSTINNHEKRKTINFDLSTIELRKIFGYFGTTKATYKKIHVRTRI